MLLPAIMEEDLSQHVIILYAHLASEILQITLEYWVRSEITSLGISGVQEVAYHSFL